MVYTNHDNMLSVLGDMSNQQKFVHLLFSGNKIWFRQASKGQDKYEALWQK